MNERQPLQIDTSLSSLETLPLDPITQYDQEGIELLAGMYVEQVARIEKDPTNDWKIGYNSANELILRLLGLSQVVERQILPDGYESVALTDAQVKGIAKLFKKLARECRTDRGSDRFILGQATGLSHVLRELGQVTVLSHEPLP